MTLQSKALKWALSALVSLPVILLVSGCGGNSVNFGKNVKDAVPDPNNPDNVAACLIDPAQFEIWGNVNQFEFVGSFGVTAGYTFGYNGGQQHGTGTVTATVHVDTARMDLSLFGRDPLVGDNPLSTHKTANQTDTAINADVTFDNGWTGGVGGLISSPIGGMTDKVLTNSVSDLRSQADNMEWIGRVTSTPDPRTVIISSGANSGLKVGDQFDIYNLTHDASSWMGAPCLSKYNGPSDKIFMGTYNVVWTTTSNAKLVLVTPGPGLNDGHVILGAEVHVKSLVGSNRNLLKRVTLNRIMAASFTLPNGKKFDFFEAALEAQIVDVLNKTKAFYLRN